MLQFIKNAARFCDICHTAIKRRKGDGEIINLRSCSSSYHYCAFSASFCHLSSILKVIIIMLQPNYTNQTTHNGKKLSFIINYKVLSKTFAFTLSFMNFLQSFYNVNGFTYSLWFFQCYQSVFLKNILNADEKTKEHNKKWF